MDFYKVEDGRMFKWDFVDVLFMKYWVLQAWKCKVKFWVEYILVLVIKIFLGNKMDIDWWLLFDRIFGN